MLSAFPPAAVWGRSIISGTGRLCIFFRHTICDFILNLRNFLNIKFIGDDIYLIKLKLKSWPFHLTQVMNLATSHFKYNLVRIPKITIQFNQLLDFCELKRVLFINILHYIHTSILKLLMKVGVSRIVPLSRAEMA